MRVLVVDDSHIERVVLRSSVEHLGHVCAVAASAEHAWAALVAEPYDVVITDWMMPGLSGPELCQRIRERPHGQYVFTVLFTSLSDRHHALDAVRAGADKFLTKPIDQIALEMCLITAERVTTMQRELVRQKAEVDLLNAALEERVRTDPLTGLGNRRRLDEDLAFLAQQVARYGTPASIVMCDLDRFKAFNDRFGHPAGDQALQQVADVLRTRVRDIDSVYRYGGEELTVLLPHQDEHAAVMAVDRLREAVEAARIPHPDNAPYGVVTLSMGIASLSGGVEERPTTVIDQADQALYRAKIAGRNRVVLARDAR